MSDSKPAQVPGAPTSGPACSKPSRELFESHGRRDILNPMPGDLSDEREFVKHGWGSRPINVGILMIIALAACLSSVPAQDLKDMNFLQLRTNCWFEIESGNGSQLIHVKIIDLKLLAWYRIRDSRPVYVDEALCWAKTATDEGPRWFLLHMNRNPDAKSKTSNPVWHLSFAYDSSNSWFLDFDRPPTNDDIYKRMHDFEFSIGADWTLYDFKIMEEDWKAAIGEAPTKKFSVKPVRRTGASRSGSDTNRTLPAPTR